jgi:cytidylate kinase
MDSSLDPRPAGRGLVVALDGPASSGKSSVGASAAARLGYRFCDTGLLYRAVTWLALDRGVALDDPASLVGLVDQVQLLDDGTGRLARVAVDDVDRTAVVRGPDVDTAVSVVARTPELRAALLARQRRLIDGARIVMAGRDIGTVVLPDADLKIFLDASAEERARRRVLERGLDPDGLEAAEILEELRRRDRLDSTRPVAPLKAASDAVVLHTDGNTLDQTVDLVVETIRAAEGAVRAGAADPAAAPSAGPPSAAPPRRPRLRQRRPIEPSRVATRITPFIWFGGIALRTIVRLIVRLRIEGDLAAIPRTGPLIVAANHTSSADPVLIGAFLNKRLGRPLNWLGKRELVERPLFGRLFRMAGIHPVDREAADLEAFRTAMRILEAGQALAVFPEGTRSRDGALQPVREGVGMLAIRSGATVVPVAIVDSDLMWPRGRLLPRFGRAVTMRFGAPLTIDDPTLDAAGAADPAAGPRRGRRRGATEAATRVVMNRIAELLPPRQRGVYADAVEERR